MASRGPAGPRGSNNRFAQFKLVLLGMLLIPGYLPGFQVANTKQENLP